MTFSPFSQLYRQISATMLALGLTHADEAAFKTWAYSAWIDSGFTPCHAVLSQPATSTTIRVELSVAVSGHRVNIHWGDGSSQSVTPQVGDNTAATQTGYEHTYSAGVLRPVVIIGRVKGFRSADVTGKTTFGGRVQGFRDSLQYLSIYGNNTLSGSVAGLTALTYFNVGGSNTLSGSVAGLTALTYFNVGGSNTLSGWELVATAVTGLCYFVHGGLTVLSSAQVNAVLAGFWTNRNAAKTLANRTIDLGKDTPTPNGAPTGQGLTDKAALQAYRSPNPPGTAALWTVTTN